MFKDLLFNLLNEKKINEAPEDNTFPALSVKVDDEEKIVITKIKPNARWGVIDTYSSLDILQYTDEELIEDAKEFSENPEKIKTVEDAFVVFKQSKSRDFSNRNFRIPKKAEYVVVFYDIAYSSRIEAIKFYTKDKLKILNDLKSKYLEEYPKLINTAVKTLLKQKVIRVVDVYKFIKPFDNQFDKRVFDFMPRMNLYTEIEREIEKSGRKVQVFADESKIREFKINEAPEDVESSEDQVQGENANLDKSPAGTDTVEKPEGEEEVDQSKIKEVPESGEKKENFGKKGEDEFFFMITKYTPEGSIEDVQITTAEDEVLFTAKDKNIDLTDVSKAIVELARESGVTSLDFNIVEKYFIEPREEEAKEESEVEKEIGKETEETVEKSEEIETPEQSEEPKIGESKVEKVNEADFIWNRETGIEDLKSKIDSLLKKKETFDKDRGSWDEEDEKRLAKLQKMYRIIHTNESKVNEAPDSKYIKDVRKNIDRAIKNEENRPEKMVELLRKKKVIVDEASFDYGDTGDIDQWIIQQYSLKRDVYEVNEEVVPVGDTRYFYSTSRQLTDAEMDTLSVFWADVSDEYEGNDSEDDNSDEDYDEDSDEDVVESKKKSIKEATPPGGDYIVKALKKEKGIKSPYAVAWAERKKGFRFRKGPHAGEKMSSVGESKIDYSKLSDDEILQKYRTLATQDNVNLDAPEVKPLMLEIMKRKLEDKLEESKMIKESLADDIVKDIPASDITKEKCISYALEKGKTKYDGQKAWAKIFKNMKMNESFFGKEKHLNDVVMNIAEFIEDENDGQFVSIRDIDMAIDEYFSAYKEDIRVGIISLLKNEGFKIEESKDANMNEMKDKVYKYKGVTFKVYQDDNDWTWTMLKGMGNSFGPGEGATYSKTPEEAKKEAMYYIDLPVDESKQVKESDEEGKSASTMQILNKVNTTDCTEEKPENEEGAKTEVKSDVPKVEEPKSEEPKVEEPKEEKVEDKKEDVEEGKVPANPAEIEDPKEYIWSLTEAFELMNPVKENKILEMNQLENLLENKEEVK